MTEPMSLSDLGAELERYELAATLSPEEFERYYDKEVELESRLIALASERTAQLEFDRSRDLLDQVIKLNQEVRLVAQRQLDRAETTEQFARRLNEAADAASGLILLMQGQICQSNAEELILGGNLAEGKGHLERATACYQELLDSSLPQCEIGRVTGALTVTKIEFFDGVAAMQRGKYGTAKDWFEEAFSKYGALTEDLENAAATDQRAQSTIEEFLRELGEQFAYTSIMIKYVDFFSQMQADNCGDALVYVDDAVSLYEAWLKRAVATAQSSQVQRIRSMELEYFKGWQSWAHAEYALENRDWDECQRQIREAKDHWFTSSDMARRHALLGMMTPQFQTANAEMLLQATTRRWKSERRLHEEIDRLRAHNRQLGATTITQNAFGGHVVKHNETSNLSIGGNVDGPVAAGHAQIHVGDRNTTATTAGDTTTTTTTSTTDSSTSTVTNTSVTDLRQLADQLAELREVLAAGASTAAERESLQHIAVAEQQARIGDEQGVRAHLKKCGQWVMSMAGKLALTAAEAAIKTSIGG